MNDHSAPASSSNASAAKAAARTRPALPAPTLTRLCAAGAVQMVRREGVTIEGAFAAQSGYNTLEARDRAFARLITATTFRRYGQISAVLKPMLKEKPPAFIMAVLETAAAQLLFLETGAHAAVGEAVNVIKSSPKTKGFGGLVNAVLRRVAEEGKAASGKTAPSDNFPRWLTNSWAKAYGRLAVRKMSLQLIKDPPLDISVKSDAAGWAEKLGGVLLPTGTVRLVSGGRKILPPACPSKCWPRACRYRGRASLICAPRPEEKPCNLPRWAQRSLRSIFPRPA